MAVIRPPFPFEPLERVLFFSLALADMPVKNPLLAVKSSPMAILAFDLMLKWEQDHHGEEI